MSNAPTLTLSELVERRRKELGLTKSAAARKAKVGRGTWHEIEAGARTEPQPETLLRIDRALNWPPGHLDAELRRSRDVYISHSSGGLSDAEITELRHKLNTYSFTLTLEEVMAVVNFIETGAVGNRNIVAELDSIQSRLDELRDALAHGAVPQHA